MINTIKSLETIKKINNLNFYYEGVLVPYIISSMLDKYKKDNIDILIDSKDINEFRNVLLKYNLYEKKYDTLRPNKVDFGFTFKFNNKFVKVSPFVIEKQLLTKYSYNFDNNNYKITEIIIDEALNYFTNYKIDNDTSYTGVTLEYLGKCSNTDEDQEINEVIDELKLIDADVYSKIKEPKIIYKKNKSKNIKII